MSDQDFWAMVKKFNEMYKLESHDTPTILHPDRISNFQDILREEIDEGSEIREKLVQTLQNESNQPEKCQEVLTEMSDWLGDIIVYCASEARRWGIPLAQVLQIIMESNFSKLGEDGQPIYDNRGKVMKGPFYWRPEEKISELLN